MEKPVIINIAPAHCGQILKINQDNVEMLSALNESDLLALLQKSELCRVALVGGEVAAFVITLREGADYQSVNYQWFSQKYSRFLYIDRVAVSDKYRHCALGTLLYNEVVTHAQSIGASTLAAEVNLEPENKPSLQFHQKFGFCEVGQQIIDGGKKKVSMQARAV